MLLWMMIIIIYRWSVFQDDYSVTLANGIITKEMNVVCPVDASGCFTEEVADFKGMHVKVKQSKEDKARNPTSYAWLLESVNVVYECVPVCCTFCFVWPGDQLC